MSNEEKKLVCCVTNAFAEYAMNPELEKKWVGVRKDIFSLFAISFYVLMSVQTESNCRKSKACGGKR